MELSKKMAKKLQQIYKKNFNRKQAFENGFINNFFTMQL